MSKFQFILKYALCAILLLPLAGRAERDWVAGPLFSEFDLTLELGHRKEAVGPLYYSQHQDTVEQWALPPFYTKTYDPSLELTEIDSLYPLFTYRRYGGEYRVQFFQLYAHAGGLTQEDKLRKRFTLFPFYFQQRSPETNQDYTAVMPFYGHLVNRLFRDDIKFVMFPAYAVTHKKDVVTTNYFYPFVHVRHGNKLGGWQIWPIVGQEQKEVTTKTNTLDEVEIIPGHKKFFALWPFFFKDQFGLGTDKPERHLTVLPFYSSMHSPVRDSVSYGWPFGFTSTDDREKKYVEHDLFWPLYVFAHGEGKTTTRIWPFYSQAHNEFQESDFYMWPVYKYNRLHSDPLDRERTRILFFLYSDTREKNTQIKKENRNVAFWPFYTYRQDMEGNSRFQALALLEPILPNSKSVVRDYSPLWSIWRSEKNAKNGATSQSLFWNLYRHQTSPEVKKTSLLFGLFQYQSTPAGRRWRVLYIPFGEKPAVKAEPKS